MAKKPRGPVVIVDPKGPLADTAIPDMLARIAAGDLPVWDPFAPSREDRAAWHRQAAKDGAAQFRCVACGEVVTIEDYDPSHYADWRRDVIQHGWIETPSGLVCSDCASRPDDATTH